MAKEKKIKPPAPAKSRHFVAINGSMNETDTFGFPWEVRRRMSKKDIKTGLRVDTEKLVGKITFSEPDQYKCSEMTMEFFDELKKEEYDEILLTVMSYADNEERMIFAKIEKDSIADKPELAEALMEMECADDPLDDRYLIYEENVTSWGPIYMCLGLSVGMCFGISQGHQGIGMCVGMLIGLVIGTSMTSSAKAAREKLKEARLSGSVPPDEDDA